MSAQDFLKTQKIGFLGVGNLGQAMLRAILDSGLVPRENIVIANRTERKLQKVAEEFQVRAVATNEELIDLADIVILGIKPQDFYQAIEPIASVFHADHTVMSLAAGIRLSALQKLLPSVQKILRVMPNTAAKIRRSVIGYAATPAARHQVAMYEELLKTMGYVVAVDDGDMMEAVTVSSSSGIGFLYELMIYWQEWLEEHGFDNATARKITTQVFAGAALLAEQNENVSFEELQRKVTSLKGVTAAGLEAMRELEIERALRISFEKAAMRDKELGKNWLRSD